MSLTRSPAPYPVCVGNSLKARSPSWGWNTWCGESPCQHQAEKPGHQKKGGTTSMALTTIAWSVTFLVAQIQYLKGHRKSKHIFTKFFQGRFLGCVFQSVISLLPWWAQHQRKWKNSGYHRSQDFDKSLHFHSLINWTHSLSTLYTNPYTKTKGEEFPSSPSLHQPESKK